LTDFRADDFFAPRPADFFAPRLVDFFAPRLVDFAAAPFRADGRLPLDFLRELFLAAMVNGSCL
jgi:hypothetical protein